MLLSRTLRINLKIWGEIIFSLSYLEKCKEVPKNRVQPPGIPPDYDLLATSRICAILAHCRTLGIGSRAVATHSCPPRQKGLGHI